MDRYQFLYDHLATEGVITKEAVDAALEDWEILEATTDDGDLIGIVMAKGSEVHLCARPEHYKRCLTRRNAKQLLWPIFEKHGYLTTRIRLSSFSKQKFVERAGFQKTWADDRFVYYMMTEKPYA